MKKDNIKAITLAAIFSALYVCITIISVYFFPLLSVLSLLIMPIFSAYYSSVFNYKYTLLYNVCVVILTFVSGIADPLYPVFYVIPSLLIGDLYGLFNKLNIKYYTTIFLQTIAYSLTNIIAILLAEKIYENNINSIIISDPFILDNFSFTILFVLSGAEAVFSSMFIFEKLKALNIKKEIEKQMPLYAHVANISIFLLSILFSFINKNIYYLLICMNIVISFPVFVDTFKVINKKNYLLFILVISLASVNYALAIFNLFHLIPLTITTLLVVYSLVKIIIYIYNISTKREN